MRRELRRAVRTRPLGELIPEARAMTPAPTSRAIRFAMRELEGAFG